MTEDQVPVTKITVEFHVVASDENLANEWLSDKIVEYFDRNGTHENWKVVKLEPSDHALGHGF